SITCAYGIENDSPLKGLLLAVKSSASSFEVSMFPSTGSFDVLNAETVPPKSKAPFESTASRTDSRDRATTSASAQARRNRDMCPPLETETGAYHRCDAAGVLKTAAIRCLALAGPRRL